MRDVTASNQTASPEPLNRTNRTVRVTEGRTYGVEVRMGTSGPSVEFLTLSVGDDRTADLLGRTLDAAYDNGATDEQARAEVFDALVYEFNNVALLQPRSLYLAYLADMDRAMDIFEPASTPDRLAELGRHVAEMAGVR